MPQRYKVLFRPSAQEDMYSIYRLIVENAGLEVAGAYLSRIETACRSLETFPLRGTARNDLLPGVRSMGFERRATILFRVDKKEVEILAVAYAGRDYEGPYRGDDENLLEKQNKNS